MFKFVKALFAKDEVVQDNYKRNTSFDRIVLPKVETRSFKSMKLNTTCGEVLEVSFFRLRGGENCYFSAASGKPHILIGLDKDTSYTTKDLVCRISHELTHYYQFFTNGKDFDKQQPGTELDAACTEVKLIEKLWPEFDKKELKAFATDRYSTLIEAVIGYHGSSTYESKKAFFKRLEEYELDDRIVQDTSSVYEFIKGTKLNT